MQNILLNGYLSSGFYYCHKAMTKATCGEKGLFGCNFHITVHHLKNLNREESQRQELIRRHGGMLLTALVLFISAYYD